MIAYHRLDCEANSKWSFITAILADGAPVGVVEVVFGKDDKDRSGFIQGLFVAEPFRRQGIARGLIRCAITACRLRGRTSAWLNVSRSNAAAVSLYESEGFFPLSYDAGNDQDTYVVNLPKLAAD